MSLVNNAGGLVRRALLEEFTKDLIYGAARLGTGDPHFLGRRAQWRRSDDSHYGPAKAAVSNLTRQLAAKGLTINSVAPGLVDNAFHRVHTPREAFEEMVKAVPAGRAGQ